MHALIAVLMLATASAAPSPAEKVVVIDPGHDPESPGAWSARGRPEYLFNEEMAALVERELSGRPGIRGMRTRCDGEVMDNWERGLRANFAKADLLLSIHHDAVRDELLVPWRFGEQTRAISRLPHGFSLHVRRDKPESVAIARAIARSLMEAHFTPSGHHVDQFEPIDLELGIYDRRSLAVLNMSAGPAVLVECGFIINPEEELELLLPEVRQRMARAIAQGVEIALGIGSIAQ